MFYPSLADMRNVQITRRDIQRILISLHAHTMCMQDRTDPAILRQEAQHEVERLLLLCFMLGLPLHNPSLGHWHIDYDALPDRMKISAEVEEWFHELNECEENIRHIRTSARKTNMLLRIGVLIQQIQSQQPITYDHKTHQWTFDACQIILDVTSDPLS